MEDSTKTADATPAPTKSTWEMVLTTTPVILTVLGTLLAGLSSSELTLAQYFRSLAAQSQSKAGDQWNFFQAKRIRGQTQEATLELVPALARLGSVSPESLQATVDRLLQSLKRSASDAEQLQLALNKAAARPDQANAPLTRASAALVKATTEASQNEQSARQALATELARPAVKSAFAYLGTKRLPEVKEEPLDDPTLNELLKAVAEHRPERDIAPLVRNLPNEAIEAAIETAETGVRQVDKAGEPVAEALDALTQAVKAAVTPVLPVHQAIGAVDAVLADVPETPEWADVRRVAASLARDDQSLRNAVEDLAAGLKVVRLDYDARRYRREAVYNRRVAALYEVQVRKLSVTSERHRDRSKKFFYGMLVAQAGVAIASMALAARLKSVLWGLAGTAGLVAFVFSGYVYLYH